MQQLHKDKPFIIVSAFSISTLVKGPFTAAMQRAVALRSYHHSLRVPAVLTSLLSSLQEGAPTPLVPAYEESALCHAFDTHFSEEELRAVAAPDPAPEPFEVASCRETDPLDQKLGFLRGCLAVGESETAYEYFCDQTGAWQHWNTKVEPWLYPTDREPKFAELLIPTLDSLRYESMLSMLVPVGKPVLFTGHSGVGKSVVIADMMQKMVDGTSGASGSGGVWLGESGSLT